MMEERNNRCDICGTIIGSPKNAHLDHDHNDGHIRGILCTNCNLGLGNMKDNPMILHKAIIYLDKN